AHIGAERILRHHRLHFGDRRAQVDIAQVGRNDGHAALVGTVDFAWTGGGDHLRDRAQLDRLGAIGLHDQPTDILHRGTLRFLYAYQHIDLAVTVAVTGGDIATHLVDHRIGDLPGGQAQRGCALLVEHDLDFRKALLHRRLDVGIVRVAAQLL